MIAMQCPLCGESHETWLKGEVYAGDNFMVEEVECLYCHAVWQNTYALTKQEVIKQ